MPAIDIYSGNALAQPKSVQDFDNEAMAAQMKRQGLQQNALALQTSQNALQDSTDTRARQAQVRQALLGLGATATDEQRVAALKGTATPEGFTQADALEKALAERDKTKAVVGKDNAAAEKDKFATQSAKVAYQAQRLVTVTNPQDAAKWYDDAAKLGHITDEQAAQGKAQVPQDPAQFQQWKQNQMLAGMNSHDQAVTAESQRHNKTEEGLTKRGQDVVASTSRANNAATIAKDYKVAGIDPQTGNFVGAGTGPDAGGGMSGMIDALGTYKVDPSTALSRMAPAMKAGVLAQVAQKYPDYDPSTYATKVKAAKDFGSGSQGNAMRSFAVAGQHLDQLGMLVDALGNKDTQIINKIGNAYASQTGNPAPTNFDAAKDVVSKEVVKAIVAGGGGVAERQELAHLMDNAKSPAQLKGVIQQYRNLMDAQHGALLQQRDAAGLPRSTLPKYTDANGGSPTAGAHPPEIADLLTKYGKK